MNALDQHTIQDAVAEVASAYPIQRAYLFGSYARGEADEKSDVDLCIEGFKGFTLFMLGGFGQEIQDRLDRRVDVAYGADSLFPSVRRQFDKDKVLLYEKS